MTGDRVLEGTWEEVAQQAERLGDRWVRLVVLDNGHEDLVEE